MAASTYLSRNFFNYKYINGLKYPDSNLKYSKSYLLLIRRNCTKRTLSTSVNNILTCLGLKGKTRGKRGRRKQSKISVRHNYADPPPVTRCVHGVMLWNIEGYTTVNKTYTHEYIFKNSDIIALTETFITSQINIKDYNTYCSYANKQNRGRPVGGLMMAVRVSIRSKLIVANEQYISVKIADTILTLFYFRPEEELEEIVATINDSINSNRNINKNLIIMGDFNCRIDNGSFRGLALTESLLDQGFSLLNPPDEPTYFCHSGSSCIDLVFYRNVDITEPETNIYFDPIRKHQRLMFSFDSQVLPERILQRRITGSLNNHMLENKIDGEFIDRCLKANDVDRASDTLMEWIKDSIKQTTPKKHYHKPWFDSNCKLVKAWTIEIFHLARRYPELREEYRNINREYKALLHFKRTNFEESQLIKMIEQSKKKPWIMFPKKYNSPNNIEPSSLQTHFYKVFNGNEPFVPLDIACQENQEREWYNSTFELEQLVNTVKNLKNKKAPGLDLIPYDLIKQYPQKVHEMWLNIYNHCMRNSVIPERWGTSKVVLLYKGKGDRRDPDNYRTISLLSCTFKIFTALINETIVNNVFHLLPKEQFGFRKHRSTSQAIDILISAIRSQLNKPKGHLYAVFVDFRKAFDSVPRNKLILKLKNIYNINGPILGIINEILKPNTLRLTDGYVELLTVKQHRGVAQGDTLSPSLFNLYIGDLPKHLGENLPSVSSIMYADDLVIFGTDIEGLQTSLHRLEEWCDVNEMKINTDKTRAIKFRRH